jgi:hypothetical protein
LLDDVLGKDSSGAEQATTAQGGGAPGQALPQLGVANIVLHEGKDYLELAVGEAGEVQALKGRCDVGRLHASLDEGHGVSLGLDAVQGSATDG